jgi:hypothetical protein
MTEAQPSFLQTAAWDLAIQAIRECPHVTDLRMLRNDNSVYAFTITTATTVTKYILHKRYTQSVTQESGYIPVLLDCLGTLNQVPGPRNGNPNYVSVSIFGYGKIQTWAKQNIML